MSPAAAAAAQAVQQLDEAAKAELKDAAGYLFFDEAGKVLASSFQVNAAELKPLTEVLGDRTQAVSKGMVVGGKRYEVRAHAGSELRGRDRSSHEDAAAGM
jgi:hypothetical protein